jgi:5-methylcytosine-specific restriction endonuclease McrA
MKKDCGKIGSGIRISVYNKTKGMCWYCGKNLIIATRESKLGNDIFCVEHIDNLGGDDISNLVPACALCNKRKRDRTLEEFRLWLSAPRFTEDQIQYLKTNGIEIPTPDLIKFYGETL